MLRRDALCALAGLALPASCRSSGWKKDGDGGKTRLVLKYLPLGEPEAFASLLRGFERDHPGLEVVAEALPNSSDLAHQFFLTTLEGGAREFDVFAVDTVWVSELARAGWVADLSDAFPPDALRRDFLAGPVEAVIAGGRTFAVPWYADVGILFYRRDLVDAAPRTYRELVDVALELRGRQPEMQGFVWQGRQYEGLVCNVYEAIWGHEGTTMRGERVLVDTAEARAALLYLRSLVVRRISPTSVTSAGEEEARRVFQNGRAVFMRNWPYASAEAEREGSLIRGKVGTAPLPTLRGEAGHGALGGYHLAINARVPAHKRDLAIALVSYLTSAGANLALALAYGRSPARRETYDDARLRQSAPLLANLLPMFERARPRPLTPFYMMISDTLQGEFSAAVTGIRTPEEALKRAQALVDHIAGHLAGAAP